MLRTGDGRLTRESWLPLRQGYLVSDELFERALLGELRLQRALVAWVHVHSVRHAEALRPETHRLLCVCPTEAQVRVFRASGWLARLSPTSLSFA